MKILAFDTCLDKMYVTLADDGKILDSTMVETTKSYYHSAFLISTIREILLDKNLTPKDIDAVATNIGPGSFTGIRACTTVARVFAQSANIKTVGVSSLEILSRISSTAHSSQLTVHHSTIVALDARKEMAYVAIYDHGKEVLAPKTILLSELKEMAANNDYFIVTDDKLQPILGGISYQKQSDDLGKYLTEIAIEKLENKDYDADWRKLHPLYIQPPALNIKKQN